MSRTPVLDWVSRHDPRSRNYPVRALIGAPPALRPVMWQPGHVLDQGEEGACVAFGWLGEALAAPVPVDLAWANLPRTWSRDPQKLAFELYTWCRFNDEFEGEDYSGTSVLTGAKAMVLLGLIGGYRWAFGITDVRDTLIAHGPVVLGIPWHKGMYAAPGGHLTVSGEQVGGHCILAIGYDPAHVFPDGTVGPAYALLNSWGTSWGVDGVAWIAEAALAALLVEGRGEACVPLQRTYARARVRVLARKTVLAALHPLRAVRARR